MRGFHCYNSYADTVYFEKAHPSHYIPFSLFTLFQQCLLGYICIYIYIYIYIYNYPSILFTLQDFYFHQPHSQWFLPKTVPLLHSCHISINCAQEGVSSWHSYTCTYFTLNILTPSVTISYSSLFSAHFLSDSNSVIVPFLLPWPWFCILFCLALC
jgi:hypothetical protein